MINNHKPKPRCKVCKTEIIEEIDGLLLGYCWCPVCEAVRDEFFGDAEMDRLGKKLEHKRS